MGEWDQMSEYVSRLDDGDETKLRGLGNTTTSGDGSSSGTFFRAVLLVQRAKVQLLCLLTSMGDYSLFSYALIFVHLVSVSFGPV